MAETVKVSLVQAQNFRMKKTDPYIRYPTGIVEMPLEHAKAMGLMHRIVRQEGVDGETVVKRDPFAGTFDEKLTVTLNKAGINTLEDLRKLSRDELLAIDGVGPAAFERIQVALSGGQ